MTARVLIVEDERLVARALRLRFEENHYVVTATVGSAAEALEAAAVQLPDVVLVDIRIQGDQDGIQAARELQERFDVPIIFLTAHSNAETVARAAQAGAEAFLIKPPNDRELMIAVEVALHKHAARRARRAQEELSTATLRSIGEAVISTDPAGRIMFMNPAAEALTGCRAEDAVGRDVSHVVRLVPGASPSTGALEDGAHPPRLGDEAMARGDGALVDPTGRRRLISDSVAPVVDERGALLGGVIVFQDVTERRALERRIEAADRLASITTLAAGVVKEVNHPLTWILTSLAHLDEGLGRETLGAEELPALRGNAEAARRGASWIERVVSDLSLFARRPDGVTTSDAGEAIRAAIASTPAPLTVGLEIEGDIEVALDEARLVQLVASLLRNAVHAVAAARADDHRITVRAVADLEMVTISVADTGIARDEEPGALSIVRGFLAGVGGVLATARAAHGGTTVSVRLPLAPRAEPAKGSGAVERASILVVDDEEAMRRLVKRILRDHDVQALEAADALLLLGAGAQFDIILCDLMMPGVSGIELYEQVLAFDPDQASRIVFVTGGAVSHSATEFLATTTNEVLPKPFAPRDLQALVRRRLAVVRAP